MHTIDLAYVGRRLHEELVAYIADQQDYYVDEGVHWRPLLALPDERPVERRPDVLTCFGTPVHRPLQLAGPVRLLLPVTSTAAVSHLVVKRCDVAPDDTSRRIIEAPHRMDAGSSSWRRAVVHLGDSGHRLDTGHRLRVQVASSCFPLYLPHTSGAEHPWHVRRAVGSTQRLLTGGPDGARLELTVLPGGDPPPIQGVADHHPDPFTGVSAST